MHRRTAKRQGVAEKRDHGSWCQEADDNGGEAFPERQSSVCLFGLDYITACPSLCHIMSGGGRPSASHGSVMGLSTAMIYSFGWGLMIGGTKRYNV